jgi:hypothetical protein
VAYYVVGGEYLDTTFQELVKPEPADGPYQRYEDAFIAWRNRARATIDLATVRFQIVRTVESAVIAPVEPSEGSRA